MELIFFKDSNIKHILFYTLIAFVSLSCNEKKDSKTAFLGGEIVNPKSNHIIVYNTKGEIADTLILDANNRFAYKITDLTPGLYSIRHGGEYQMVLIEPTDSIMFRLNTYDFDESLVFTGQGAKKNNYLIKTYLTNELEDKKLMEHSKLEPEVFHEFIEERRLNRLNEFYDFLDTNDESDFFKSVIEANINYNAYADKEIYPFAYFGNNKLIHIKDLPDNFYEYRKNTNFNVEHLNNFFSYNRFLFSYIDNSALQIYYKNKPFHSTFNRHTIDYNKAKLYIIDSIIENPEIKSNLLKYKTRDFISHSNNKADIDEFLKYYLGISTNEVDRAYMKNFVKALEALEKGKKLPSLTLVNFNNQEQNLNTIITKPTVIYFWSTNLKQQFRNNRYKVKELKVDFPTVDFISINVDSHSNDNSWKSNIKRYNYNAINEYRFKDPKTALQTLAINYVNKAIVVNTNGEILCPNTNIFNEDFKSSLNNLLGNRN